MLFASDLDNTLIHSYKSANAEDICVEVKDGKELSFMSPRTYAQLQKIVQRCRFVPVTTRSLEQYRRLDLGVKPEYAVVAHGGLLLINGEVDEEWTLETNNLLCLSLPRIKANKLLFDIRYVNEFFIFAKSELPQKAIEYLRSFIDEEQFTVCAVHNKVYILPTRLDKGLAVKRLAKRLNIQKVISAGDSQLDIPMLRNADIAIFPESLNWQQRYGYRLDSETFTSEILDVVWDLINNPADGSVTGSGRASSFSS